MICRTVCASSPPCSESRVTTSRPLGFCLASHSVIPCRAYHFSLRAQRGFYRRSVNATVFPVIDLLCIRVVNREVWISRLVELLYAVVVDERNFRQLQLGCDNELRFRLYCEAGARPMNEPIITPLSSGCADRWVPLRAPVRSLFHAASALRRET